MFYFAFLSQGELPQLALPSRRKPELQVDAALDRERSAIWALGPRPRAAPSPKTERVASDAGTEAAACSDRGRGLVLSVLRAHMFT